MSNATNVESNIEEMINILKKKCPVLCPSIFSSQHSFRSLQDLCTSKEQKEQIRLWQSKLSSPFLAYSTEIDLPKRTIKIAKIYSASELDCSLYQLEKMINLIVMGEESQLTIAMTRFLEVNGYSGDITEERHIFNEVYNLAFTIKALLSNIPMQLALGDLVLPCGKDVQLQKKCKELLVEGFFDKSQTSKQKKSLPSKEGKPGQNKRNLDNENSQSSDSSSDDESDEDTKEVSKKRRKRRRGKSSTS